MRYYKKVNEEGKLLLIGIGEGGEEISEAEYNALLEEIRNTPIVLPEITEEDETDGSD